MLLNKTNFTRNLRLSTSYPNTEHTHNKQEFKLLLQWTFQCKTSGQHHSLPREVVAVPSHDFCSLCTWTRSVHLHESQQQCGLVESAPGLGHISAPCPHPPLHCFRMGSAALGEQHFIRALKHWHKQMLLRTNSIRSSTLQPSRLFLLTRQAHSP